MFRVLKILFIIIFFPIICLADYYDGDSWENANCYRYTGAAWGPCSSYRYTGAAWELSGCLYEATEITCDDGCDNDRDGDIDEADSDCGGGSLNWNTCLLFVGAESNDGPPGEYTLASVVEYSAGDTTGAYGDEGLTISGTSPLSGTYSFVLGGYGGLQFVVSSNDIFPSQVGTIYAVRRFTAMPSTGGREYLYHLGGDTYTLAFDVFNDGDSWEIEFRVFDGSGFATWETTDASLTTDTTYVLAVAFDGTAGTAAIYRNGTALTTTGGGTFGALTDFTQLMLADWNNEAGEGQLDNIQVHNVAHNSTEVGQYGSADYGD